MYWSFFDPTFIVLIPAIILVAYARNKVKKTFSEYSNYAASSGATGAEVARRILRDNDLGEVSVESIEGNLTDHYDPREKVLRLSRPVYGSNSLAAVGVAAHEAGHAVQDRDGYAPMKFRQGIWPVAQFGNTVGVIMFMVGLLMLIFTRSTGALWIARVGVGLFALGTLFTFATLPVEFNASKRALVALEGSGVVSSAEKDHAKRVLDAAALTYVAAAFMALMMLLRFILLLAMAGGRE